MAIVIQTPSSTTHSVNGKGTICGLFFRCMTRTDPDDHQASLFRKAHKLTGAAGHASLVRKLTSFRQFESYAKCIGTLLVGQHEKKRQKALKLSCRPHQSRKNIHQARQGFP